ncbi:MAG: hypothetical protein ACI4B5_04805 [Bacteroidaceae bacterium]
MMNRNLGGLLFLLMTQVLCSCGKKTDDHRLEEALLFAGDNRAQLEQVLAHYADDSLKLAAAEYLIANMPGHYSYADTDSVMSYSRRVRELCIRIKGVPSKQLRDSVNAYARECGIPQAQKVFDSKILTAGYMIRNIDEAFRSWKQGKWARHLSFDEFCEYLLPYKVVEMQLLDDWRTRLQGLHCQGLDELDWCDLYANSALQAARLVNGNLNKLMNPDHGAYVSYQNMKVEDALALPMGNCDFYVFMATILLRSQGIPVAMDFTPHWAYRDNGHSWNVVFTNEGREEPFTGVCTQPGDLHKPDERMPKTFRCTYAQNHELQDLNRREKFVPRFFRNIFMRDVTSHYIACSDVTLNVNVRHGSYVYLAVYDTRRWAPVAYAEVKQGRATFKDMGRNILYVPLRYHEDGTEELVGSPFVLEYDGRIRTLEQNDTTKETVTLRRRFPTLGYVYEILGRSIGGEFQVSNDAGFADYQVVHRITDGHAYGYEFEIPDSVGAYRYWRYKQDSLPSYCNMAEMKFYDAENNAEIKGDVIGTMGSYMNRGGLRESVFDGDALTFFDAPDAKSSWVGMDFGKPVRLGRVYYVFRGDGNTVEPGDVYQLYFWNKNRWQLLHTCQAEHPWLQFPDIPQNALLLLRDRTRGIETRPFTYEEGRQVWW